MIISDNRREFYDQIVANRQHVLIMVSHDIDSLAAAKIIRYLFECDHVPYTIVPIRTRQEIQRSYRERIGGIKYILMINLGSSIDVIELLLPENDVKIFIADCHRPFNVQNVYSKSSIHLLCSISDLNNIENEFEKIPKYDEVFWDSNDPVDDYEMDVKSMTLEQLKRRQDFKKFEKNRQQIMTEYEQMTYYSYSTSILFFDLAWKLGKDSNELLWLTILAIADKQNAFKLPTTLMKNELNYLQQSMHRLRNIRSDNAFIMTNNNNDSSTNELSTITNHLTIKYEKDLNLNLYREWSLYDSICHTMYTSCGFKIWKMKGHKRLHQFLAELGLPLNQCRQKFKSMDLDLRKRLLEEFEEKKSKYNLSKLICYNFIGYRGINNTGDSTNDFSQKTRGNHKYSSVDLAMAARALLESSDKQKSFNEKFFDSFESLSTSSMNSQQLINLGINMAKIQLSAIVKQVQLIIDAHLISLMNNVLWYVIIPESTPDAHLFCHPGCLKTLAIYTLSAYASFNSKSQRAIRLPLVLVTPDPERQGIGVVCGCPPLLALKECHTFYRQAFATTSKRMSAINEQWTFEESIIDPDIVYISYKDSYNFLHEFSLLLESTTTQAITS